MDDDDRDDDWEANELPYWADPADCLGCGVCGWCVGRSIGAAADVPTPSSSDTADGEG